MNLKVKKEKGITLIALIVTIIVLLILAAISIAMLTGQNGILGKAADTKKTTSSAQLDEQVKLAIMEARLNGLGKIESTEALDNALKNNVGEGNYTLTETSTGWEITTVYKKYVLDADGNLTIGDNNQGGEGDTTISWEQKSDGTIQSSDGKVALQIGDYVNYDPTHGGNLTNNDKCKYTAPQGTHVLAMRGQDGQMEFGTGYNEEQQFTLDNNTQWRVMGIENGRIMLISKDILSKKLYLRGQTGYQYGPDIINDISKIYGYGEGATEARAIKAEDINKVTGFLPKKNGSESTYYKGLESEYDNIVTFTVTSEGISYNGNNGVNGINSQEIVQKGFRFYDENENSWKSLGMNESTMIKSYAYHYFPDTLTMDTGGTTVIPRDSALYDTLFSSDYVLASNFVYIRECIPQYSLRTIEIQKYNNNRAIVAHKHLFQSTYGANITDTTKGSDVNFGVRPIVYLEPTIQLEPGRQENHWLIVKK